MVLEEEFTQEDIQSSKEIGEELKLRHKMVEEKTFNIPIRKEFQKAPKYKRAKKAISAVKLFLNKHMKSDNVKVHNSINLKIWERGIKNPPHHVKVIVSKDDKGVVNAHLFGTNVESKKEKSETNGKTNEVKKAVVDAVKPEVKKEETTSNADVSKAKEPTKKAEVKKD